MGVFMTTVLFASAVFCIFEMILVRNVPFLLKLGKESIIAGLIISVGISIGATTVSPAAGGLFLLTGLVSTIMSMTCYTFLNYLDANPAIKADALDNLRLLTRAIGATVGVIIRIPAMIESGAAKTKAAKAKVDEFGQAVYEIVMAIHSFIKFCIRVIMVPINAMAWMSSKVSNHNRRY